MKTTLLNFFKNVGVLLLIATFGMSCSDNGVEVILKKGTDGPFPDYGKVLAFPTAEGYGANATGGRGGEIYHVTTLDDNGGEGSLRAAVSKPDRIIVFDVAGVIHLKEVLVFSKNLTIAAQTAPGDGVVLYGNRVSFTGASNFICRHLRIRMGIEGPDGKDAAGIANGENMIFDHLSVTWGRDENFSINWDSKGTLPRNITIQNSILGQGLQNHSCGGLIQTDTESGITLFRNLYTDNKTRNPKVKGLNQFVNNVVYNWGSGAAYNMGGDSSGQSETTIENNYFIVGPVDNWQNVRQEDNSIKVEKVPMNPTPPFLGGNADFRVYYKGNYYDNDKDGSLNGFELTQGNWTEYCKGEPTFLSTPSDQHPVISQQTSAAEAYHWIVKHVGASLPDRDEVDRYLVDELTSLGKKGTIIQNEQDVQQYALGGVGAIQSEEKPLDSDNDGMPDEFEDKYGLDKNDPSDAAKIANNGYTNIENYIFTLDAKLND